MEADSRANALTIDAQGDIGIGRTNASTDVHVQTGNTPTYRIDQDGSSGFTPQTWDIAGNEANFFVRDVTNGSRLPFRIEPAATTDSLRIDADGNIGLDTANPDRSLHVSALSEPEIRLEARTDAQEWDVGLDSAERFVIRDVTGAFNVLQIDDATHNFSMFGDATVSGNLTVASCTGCGVPSDRSIKRQFSPVDANAVLDAVGSLPISTWSYSADRPWVRHIGPTAQDFAAAFGFGSSNRIIAPVDMNGVALAAVQALIEENAAQDALIAELSARLAALEAASG